MLQAIKDALSTWSPGTPPAATWLLPELRTVLRAEFAGAYRPAATEAGWSLDFMHGAGDNARVFSRNFRSYVARMSPSEQFLGHSNPHLVQAAQRNRVMPLGELARLNVDQPYRPLFQAIGILGHDQLRVLICDGPRQLSWIGATREERFTEREVTLLRRLTRPLQRRLRLEQQFGPGALPGMFDAALEALRTAAFVVGPSGAIEMANSVGRALLERGRQDVLSSISQSAQQGSNAGAFSINRVTAPGWPAYMLAIRKESPELAERVLLVQARWGLSARQARVLELVADGVSNKEIALALGCAEVTIENHLTELFRRSGARSRAGLVGRLISLPTAGPSSRGR
jgi:DNA-binding CsgD family transcriptional regulator